MVDHLSRLPAQYTISGSFFISNNVGPQPKPLDTMRNCPQIVFDSRHEKQTAVVLLMRKFMLVENILPCEISFPLSFSSVQSDLWLPLAQPLPFRRVALFTSTNTELR